jgi:hypothetical protein
MPEASPSPASLRWAVWLLAAQATVLTAGFLFLLYEDFTGAASSAGSAAAVTLFVVVLAGLFGVFAFYLRQRRMWPRGPSIVLELLLVPIGYSMVGGGLAIVGIPLMLVGLVGAGLLLAPSTRAALGRN